MGLILDPGQYATPVLVELYTSLRKEVEELGDLIQHPRGPVRNAAGLELAETLRGATIAATPRIPVEDRAWLAVEINLLYGTLLTVIDLVKSHTDVPWVPKPRSPPPAADASAPGP